VDVDQRNCISRAIYYLLCIVFRIAEVAKVAQKMLPLSDWITDVRTRATDERWLA
jgi:hypothetical protein